MADVKEFLGPLRPEVLFINGNEEAMALALLFGVADKLNDPKTPGACGKYVTFETHPTHWVVCYRAWRNKHPKDNGWATWFFPKSAVTLEEVFARFEAMGGSKPSVLKSSDPRNS